MIPTAHGATGAKANGMEPTKRCSHCCRVLPLSGFYRTRRSPDGRHWQCKECQAEHARKAYESGRYLDARMRACEANPSRKAAYMAVSLALKAGILTRPDHCSGCGCPDTERRIEAHHADYARPLDVIWLCTKCHRRVDAMRREREAEARA